MLTVNKDLLQQITSQAKRGLPNEACGILAGKDGCVTKVYEMTNTEHDPELFLMDAKEQFAAMKDMRSSGLEMLGIYHSHVASAAFPSAHDVQMALYPDTSYVIISLKDQNNPEVRSFKIKEANVEEEELRWQ